MPTLPPARSLLLRRRIPRVLIAALLVGLGSPGLAEACWDGYAAQVGRFSYSRLLGRASWNPEHARQAARWGHRIEALLPADVELVVEPFAREATCNGHGCGGVTVIPIGNGDLPVVFRRVAAAFGVPAWKVRRARTLEPVIYTVQLFAGGREHARALADRFDPQSPRYDAGASGDDRSFFSEGGFPAVHREAHVLHQRAPASAGLYRVVTGLYLSAGEARKAQRSLQQRGYRGVVRPLPAGRALFEPVSTKEG